jgi:hypothetical protein
MTTKKQTPAPAHRIEKRLNGSDLEKLVIWHGDKVVFHLERMSDGHVWFSTYINESEPVSMTSESPIVIRPTGDQAPRPRAKKTPGNNAEKSHEMNATPAAATASESET